MGLCCPGEVTPTVDPNETKNSRTIDDILMKNNKSEKRKMKLLLLGAGDSGKSTLVKQMTTIYKDGFPESDRKALYPALCNNIICSMKTLCKQSAKFGQVETANIELMEKIMALDSNHKHLSNGVAEMIQKLWEDSGIQMTYSFNSRYYLSDSSSYFFQKVADVADRNYIPTEQDVFRIRIPTTGIIQNRFEVEGTVFQMFDVGGQRSERKKWIHCFDNVTSVIFVAALSAYDQVLYEDEGMNRMQESLDLLSEISNLKWFEKTAFILFLNKTDLFANKIAKVPLKDWYSEYKGEDKFEPASQFMKELFADHFVGSEDVFIHLTCATDTGNVQKVFNSVKDIIVRKGLEKAGIV